MFSNFRGVFTGAIIFFSLVGCSSVTIKHHAVGHQPPLCNTAITDEKIVVYWGAAWRTDQKEVSIREGYIEEGIKKFFNSKRCFEAL
jgi:hypothetical protein